MPGSRVLLVALAPRTINQQPHPTPRPPHAAVVRISQAGWAVAAAVSSQVKSSQGPPLARGHRRCEFLSGRVRNCGDERQRSSREISGAIRIIMRWRQTRVDAGCGPGRRMLLLLLPGRRRRYRIADGGVRADDHSTSLVSTPAPAPMAIVKDLGRKTPFGFFLPSHAHERRLMGAEEHEFAHCGDGDTSSSPFSLDWIGGDTPTTKPRLCTSARPPSTQARSRRQ